ncbi:MAG: transcriptional regulator NrdR [Coriobacteriales bacterium]|nr:transcriptional regulator NrdR [Coriobacteriales bacterium]
MFCQQCGSTESRVIDSRPSEDGKQIRRRRECEACGWRFTTVEAYRDQSLIVHKKDKSSEPFDREKLLRGLLTATVKRDVALETLEALINDVEAELNALPKREIESERLGELVMERLRDIDAVAYIRFASVYKDFKDIDEFQHALKGM